MNQIYKNILNNLSSIQTPKHKDECVLIVDSMNTFMRSFSIISHLNPTGNHVGGLTGFLKSVGYAVKLYKPTKVILVFDGEGNSTNKRYLYSEYKTNRNTDKITNWKVFNNKDEEVDAMVGQMKRLIEYINNLPVHVLSIPKIEADDVIGFITNEYEQNINCKSIILMSADRDFLQLVSEKTNVYSPTKKKLYKIGDVLNEYKVHPNNFINYKILLGDKGDNVPGIKGLGEIKLLKLFPEFENPQHILLGEIIEKSRLYENHNPIYSKILNFESQLKINLQLMDIKNPNIGDSDKIDIINYISNECNKFNIENFLQMVKIDILDDRTNWLNWLNETFSSFK